MRHARHLSGTSTGLDAPPWPSVRRGRHFLDASPVEEVSPWRVKYGRHFAESPPTDRPRSDWSRAGLSIADQPIADQATADPATADPASADQPVADQPSAERSRTDRGAVSAAIGGEGRTPVAAIEGIVREFPASLLQVVAAAVDPLEIAASLETCGLSNAMVHERFGYRDTFSLAERLYSAVEFQAAPVTEVRANRPGGMPDLGRGLVFAMPTLMFAGAAIALHSALSWWTAPLALICGWAFSQFVAYLGFSREAVAEPAGAAVVWGLLGALSSCVCLGLIGEAVLGGTYSGIAFAAAACAFATAAAALVVHAQERLIAVMLIPGALASLVFITGEPFQLPAAIVIALVAGSVGGTVLAALRHVPALWWRLPAVTRVEAPAAARSFANGSCCGLFLAILVVLQPGDTGLHKWPAVAAYPMILSLGVMEWQVRSLRAGARRGLTSVYNLGDFATVVKRKLARASFSYLGALLLLTVVVRALAYERGVPVPTSLLLASTCLSVAFFLALVVTSYGRVDLVLRAWLAGLAVFGALGLSAAVGGRGWTVPDAQLAFLGATFVALTDLALTARHVILDPACHG